MSADYGSVPTAAAKFSVNKCDLIFCPAGGEACGDVQQVSVCRNRTDESKRIKDREHLSSVSGQ